MANKPRIKPELLDKLLEGQDASKIFESEGLINELNKALAERVLDTEMNVHLDQEAEQAAGNHRNGHSRKTVLRDTGSLPLPIPRGRQARFEPQLIAKYRRRFPGFDEEITAWRNRPLESTYAIVFFDALRVKIRDEGMAKNKAVYLAIGVRYSGHKEVLGLWIEQTEGAKFWLKVMTELRNRGTQDILIAVVDGLKGFPGPSRSCSPKRSFRRASSISFATRYSLPRGRSERRWPLSSSPSPEVRRIIYTTNTIESLHRQARKAVRGRGHFPSDQAATKLIWLVLQNAAAK